MTTYPVAYSRDVLVNQVLHKCTKVRVRHPSYPFHIRGHGTFRLLLPGCVQSAFCNLQRIDAPFPYLVDRRRQPVQWGNGGRPFAYTKGSLLLRLRGSIRPERGWLYFLIIMDAHFQWVVNVPENNWPDDDHTPGNTRRAS